MCYDPVHITDYANTDEIYPNFVSTEINYGNEICIDLVHCVTESLAMGYAKELPQIKDDVTPRPIKSYIDLWDTAAEQVRTHYVTYSNGTQFHPTLLGT